MSMSFLSVNSFPYSSYLKVLFVDCITKCLYFYINISTGIWTKLDRLSWNKGPTYIVHVHVHECPVQYYSVYRAHFIDLAHTTSLVWCAAVTGNAFKRYRPPVETAWWILGFNALLQVVSPPLGIIYCTIYGIPDLGHYSLGLESPDEWNLWLACKWKREVLWEIWFLSA